MALCTNSQCYWQWRRRGGIAQEHGDRSLPVGSRGEAW